MGILDRGKSQADRDPFIPDGRHKLAIERYFAFKHETHGFSIGCTFLVLETTNPSVAPGTSVFKAWNIKRGPKYKGDKCDGELNDATKFLARLVGGVDEDAHRTANAALDGEDQYDGPNQRRNPLRGMVIDAVGVAKATKQIDQTTGQPKMWTDVTFYHNAQAEDAAQIAAMRAHLDAVKPVQAAAPVQAPAAAPQAPAPQYAQPAPQGYGYPPGVPAPQAPQYAPSVQPPAYPPPLAQAPQYPPQGYAPPPAGVYPGATPQYPAAPAAPTAPSVLPPGLIPGTGR